jgi:hypothetical protein
MNRLLLAPALGAVSVIVVSCTLDFDTFRGAPTPPPMGGMGGQGGDGGAIFGMGGDAGTGGQACGENLPAPGGSCPDMCEQPCTDNVCRIVCQGASECANDNIVCPPGLSCELACRGPSSCANVTLKCPVSASCEAQCGGPNACSNLNVQCGTRDHDLRRKRVHRDVSQWRTVSQRDLWRQLRLHRVLSAPASTPCAGQGRRKRPGVFHF